MTIKTYKVHYFANDGAACNFVFKSDRSFSMYRRDDANAEQTLANPILDDMLRAAKRYEEKPESSMNRHGGFKLSNVRFIECVETGAIKLFAAYYR